MHDRVYNAAVELFIKQGFDSTTMDGIAGAADVARATVFNHFPRKTAFLDEWSSRRRQRALAAVEAERRETHSLREIFTVYMIELAYMSASTRKETVALMGATIQATNVLSDPPLAGELAAFVSLAQGAGEVRGDLDAQHTGLLAAAGYFTMLSRWIAADSAPFDLQAALLQMVDLLFRGIVAGPT